MAHVNDPGDDGVPEQPRDERDEDDGGIPEPLFNYFVFWHRVYNVIIHRGLTVAPLQVPPYTADLLATKSRPVPFPLNISETWACGTLLVLVFVAHDGATRGWLLENASPYAPWAGRVLGRVLLTVGTAVLSTLSFEVAGSVLTDVLYYTVNHIQERISIFLIKRFGWGELDDNGEPQRDGNDDFIWIRDPLNRQEFALQAILGFSVLAFHYLTNVFIKMATQIFQVFVEQILSPTLYFFLAIPVDFVPKLLSWLSLPAPALDEIQDPRTLWFEYGIPAAIQFWVLVLFWLLKILYLAKAERLAMQGWQITDPKMNLVWHLIRATAFHLLAYTAYQLVCGVIVGIKWTLPPNTWYTDLFAGPIPIRFLQRLIPEGRLFAAALLLLFHWLLRAASGLAVRLARPFWMPYILWQTRFSKGGARLYWPSFVNHLIEDFSVIDPKKRVTSRVVMTALFGLGSSWPALFHLSGIVRDE
ncbi:hypothetical protein F5X97DRAFT_135377 [Nemania serpens]|nr:hypothetical protein F5X97DRAFT_135377 [Nemania serpens]